MQSTIIQSFALSFLSWHWEQRQPFSLSSGSQGQFIKKGLPYKLLHIAVLSPTAHSHSTFTPCKLWYTRTHTQPAATHDCPAKARHHGNCSFPWSDHFIVCTPCQYILSLSLSLSLSVCLSLSLSLYLLQRCQHKQTQPRLMSTATQIVELLASCADEWRIYTTWLEETSSNCVCVRQGSDEMNTEKIERKRGKTWKGSSHASVNHTLLQDQIFTYWLGKRNNLHYIVIFWCFLL